MRLRKTTETNPSIVRRTAGRSEPIRGPGRTLGPGEFGAHDGEPFVVLIGTSLIAFEAHSLEQTCQSRTEAAVERSHSRRGKAGWEATHAAALARPNVFAAAVASPAVSAGLAHLPPFRAAETGLILPGWFGIDGAIRGGRAGGLPRYGGVGAALIVPGRSISAFHRL